MLKTIVVPKDLRLLRDRLPEANYDDNPTASYNLAVGQLQAKPPAPSVERKGQEAAADGRRVSLS